MTTRPRRSLPSTCSEVGECLADLFKPIQLQVKISEDLHNALQSYLESNPGWSQTRVFSAATALFLMQNGGSDHSINRTYLDALFVYEDYFV
ncbi:DUF2811 domain-containing protein [Nodosilinea sp. PGN35]|uniref:DUF2811 domain-containing protein n=1 Tax=Nodosilinea sp. PGN35 TaxID=3020489 RepID=UPI00398AFFE8